MPLAILWTNLSEEKFTNSVRIHLINLLASCAQKSADGTGLVVHTDCKCSLGTNLNEPALFMLFKASGSAINPLANGDHAHRICPFFRAHLGIPAYRIIIQFEQLDRANIGFCGTTKLESDRNKEENETFIPGRKKSLGFFEDKQKTI